MFVSLQRIQSMIIIVVVVVVYQYHHLKIHNFFNTKWKNWMNKQQLLNDDHFLFFFIYWLFFCLFVHAFFLVAVVVVVVVDHRDHDQHHDLNGIFIYFSKNVTHRQPTRLDQTRHAWKWCCWWLDWQWYDRPLQSCSCFVFYLLR